MFKNTFYGVVRYWKLPVTILATSIITTGLTAQRVKSAEREAADWTFNLGVGYGNYFGDLSPYSIKNFDDWKQVKYFFDYNKNFIKKPSFHLSVEHTFNNSSGVLLSFNQTNIMMSDRYIGRDGIYRTGNENFNRALNFKSEIYDIGVGYKIKSSKTALIAPYLWLGAGASYFKSSGDLYDAAGQNYNYMLPETQTDGSFETPLRDLRTETDVKYNNIVPYANLGIGVSVRFNNQFSLALETDVKYSFSDYIDDVSGLYKQDYQQPASRYAAHPGTNIVDPLNPKRGNDDGVNDFYIQNRLVLKFSFFSAKRQESIKGRNFKAPVIFPGYYTSTVPDSAKRNKTIEDSSNVVAANPLLADTTAQQSVSSTHAGSDTVYYKIIPRPVDNRNIHYLPLERKRFQNIRRWNRNRGQIAPKDNIYYRDTFPRNFDNIAPNIRLRGADIIDTVYLRLDTSLIKNDYIRPKKEGLDSNAFLTDTSFVINTEKRIDTVSTAQIDSIQNKLQALYERNDSLRNSLEAIRYEKELNQIKLLNDSLKLEQLKKQLGDRDTALANLNRSRNAANNRRQDQGVDNDNELAKLEKQVADLKARNAVLENRIQSYPVNTTVPVITRADDDVNVRQLRAIQDDIRSLNNQMNRKNFNPVISPVIPIQGNNNNRDLEREVIELRAELSKMRMDAARVSGDSGHQRIDTIVVAQPVAHTAPGKIDSLQAALVTIANNLEALKKQQSATQNQPIQTVTVMQPQTISLFFNTGATTVTNAQLNKLATPFNTNSLTNIASVELNAYTDATGNRTVNERISRQRAEFVQNYLINNKMATSGSITINYFPSSNEGGKSSNAADRRVDVIIHYK